MGREPGIGQQFIELTSGMGRQATEDVLEYRLETGDGTVQATAPPAGREIGPPGHERHVRAPHQGGIQTPDVNDATVHVLPREEEEHSDRGTPATGRWPFAAS
jgi:hypothetical protein